MSKQIKLRRGLDIKLKGRPVEQVSDFEYSETYSVKPTDFKNLTPKLVINEGEKVKAGTPLFIDKYNPLINFTSPVSGQILEIVRGERRKILDIIIKADANIEYEKFDIQNINDKTTIIDLLLKSGLWTTIRQRPYGIIPNPEIKPKAIHVSTFDSAPLSPDYNFILKDRFQYFQDGLNVLKKLTDGSVNININSNNSENIFKSAQGVNINEFSGPHPAGNVSVQIHHTTPVNKGEIIWVINPQDVADIGRFFKTGKYDVSKIIAIAGSEVQNPKYHRIIKGANVSNLLKNNLKSENVRVISGNVLSGTKIDRNGFLCAYDNLITVIPEGDRYDFFGWALPGVNKFSTSRTFFAWLCPKKEYSLDTNYNGGKRAFVVTGEYEKYVPMDILPMQLFKAILAEDVDKMENLGIYEIVEEDFALCEFACTSKTEIQEIISNGINLMIKEMS